MSVRKEDLPHAISGEVFKKFVLIFSGFSLAFKAPFVLCFCLSGLGIRIVKLNHPLDAFFDLILVLRHRYSFHRQAVFLLYLGRSAVSNMENPLSREASNNPPVRVPCLVDRLFCKHMKLKCQAFLPTCLEPNILPLRSSILCLLLFFQCNRLLCPLDLTALYSNSLTSTTMRFSNRIIDF